MRVALDKKQFGPWALVTGASSGIGKEFARQIAASGINVVLVARRESLLDEVGQGLAKDFNVQYRTVVADLSQEGFLDKLGFEPRTMPMKPMSVEQCVSEGLNALRENRSRIVPGQLNRFMDAFVPAFVKR